MNTLNDTAAIVVHIDDVLEEATGSTVVRHSNSNGASMVQACDIDSFEADNAFTYNDDKQPIEAGVSYAYVDYTLIDGSYEDDIIVHSGKWTTVSKGTTNEASRINSGYYVEMDGGSGNDIITINSVFDDDDNIAIGNDGNDIIYVSAGSDNTLEGGAGDDRYVIGNLLNHSYFTIDQSSAASTDKDTLSLLKYSVNDFKYKRDDYGTILLKHKTNDAQIEIINWFSKPFHLIKFADESLNKAAVLQKIEECRKYYLTGNDQKVTVSDDFLDRFYITGDRNLVDIHAPGSSLIQINGDNNKITSSSTNDTVNIAGSYNYVYADYGDDTINVNQGLFNKINGCEGDDTYTIDWLNSKYTSISNSHTYFYGTSRDNIVLRGVGIDDISFAYDSLADIMYITSGNLNAIDAAAGNVAQATMDNYLIVKNWASGSINSVQFDDATVLREYMDDIVQDFYTVNANVCEAEWGKIYDFSYGDKAVLNRMVIKYDDSDYNSYYSLEYDAENDFIKIYYTTMPEYWVVIRDWEELDSLSFADGMYNKAAINALVEHAKSLEYDGYMYRFELDAPITKDGYYQMPDTYKIVADNLNITVCGGTSIYFENYWTDNYIFDITKNCEDGILRVYDGNSNACNVISTVTIKDYYSSSNPINDVVLGRYSKYITPNEYDCSYYGSHVEDIIYVLGDKSRVDAGDGDDIIEVNGASGDIDCGEGNDTVYLNGDNNFVMGRSGDDTFYVAGNHNTVRGYDDNDVFYVQGSDNFLQLDGNYDTDMATKEVYLAGGAKNSISCSKGYNKLAVKWNTFTSANIYDSNSKTVKDDLIIANASINDIYINSFGTQIKDFEGEKLIGLSGLTIFNSIRILDVQRGLGYTFDVDTLKNDIANISSANISFADVSYTASALTLDDQSDITKLNFTGNV